MTNDDQPTDVDQWSSILKALRSPVSVAGLGVLVLNSVFGVIARTSGRASVYLPWVLCGILGLVLTTFAVVVLWRRNILEGTKSKCDVAVEPTEWDVFVSSPMSSFPSEDDYQEHRHEVHKVVDILRTTCGFARVYWASERFTATTEFEEKNIAFEKDSLALRRSARFLLIYPPVLPSSVLVEAGMALAWEKPSVYWYDKKATLPFMLDQAGQARGAKSIVYGYSTIDEIVQHFRINKGAAFDIR